jgi:hypothetical protein
VDCATEEATALNSPGFFATWMAATLSQLAALEVTLGGHLGLDQCDCPEARYTSSCPNPLGPQHLAVAHDRSESYSPTIAYELGGYVREVQTEVTVGVVLAVGVGHRDQKGGSSASTSQTG